MEGQWMRDESSGKARYGVLSSKKGQLFDDYYYLLQMGKEKHSRHSRQQQRERTKHRKYRHSSSEQHHRDNKKHRSRHEKEYHYEEHHDEKRQVQNQKEEKQKIVKQLPCWEPSGILLKFYNARDGVSLKFHEPPEARNPTDIWKIYVFKGEEVLQPIQLSQSCYLIGKDQRICDILCLNPSISRQHAVIQFRLISKMNIEGDYSETVRPYIIDLGSTNGTFLNDEKIEPSRYVQLLHKDVLRFGFSDRLYVAVKTEGTAQAVEQQQE